MTISMAILDALLTGVERSGSLPAGAGLLKALKIRLGAPAQSHSGSCSATH